MATLQWIRQTRQQGGGRIAYRLIDTETREVVEHLSGWLTSERSLEDLGEKRARLSAEYEHAGYRVLYETD